MVGWFVQRLSSCGARLLSLSCLPPHFFSRRAAWLIFSGLSAAAVAAPTVYCSGMYQTRDIPDYLVPYYLRSCRARFVHYASIKLKNGRKYMTTQDFLCALLATPQKKLSNPFACENIHYLFDAVDKNSDGKLSFAEFQFLMVLLATKRRDIELGFRMFDRDSRGALTKEEFLEMIMAFGDFAFVPRPTGRVMEVLFGDDFTRLCTFETFMKIVHGLQMEVTKAEFRQYDTEENGYITAESFGKLIANSMVGAHLPFYIVENVREMAADRGGKVSFSLYNEFVDLMRKSDDIGIAIQLYTMSGSPLRRDDFCRAVESVGLPSPTKAEVDLVYRLFDRDGDGVLEHDEFLSIMNAKMTFHVEAQKKPDRQNFFVRLAKCTDKAITAGIE